MSDMRGPIVGSGDEKKEAPAPQPSASGAGGSGPPTAVGADTGGSDDGGNDPPRFTGGPLWMEHFGRWYNVPIEDLDLSMRAYNCLRRSGIMIVGQVLEKSEEELLSLRNFGCRCYDELRDKLDVLGILAAPPEPASGEPLNPDL